MRIIAALCAIMIGTLAAAQDSAPLPRLTHAIDSAERLQKGDLSGLVRLRFLTTVDFPPFNYLDSGGRLTGFNVDLARAVCNELEIANLCQIQALPWEDLESGLANGQGEAIIAGRAADAAARKTLEFTLPYMRPAARFITQKTSPLDFSDGLDGKTIAVAANSAHEQMLRSFFPKAAVVSLPTNEAVYAQLVSGKAQAVFGDAMTLSFWLSRSAAEDCCIFSGGAYFSDAFLGNGMRIALKAEDAALTQSLNFALKTVQDKGVLDELYLKYFPVGVY